MEPMQLMLQIIKNVLGFDVSIKLDLKDVKSRNMGDGFVKFQEIVTFY